MKEGFGRRADLRVRHAGIGVGLKENLYYRATVHGLRFDVLDVFDHGSYEAFMNRHDSLFHLLRRQSGVIPGKADDRNIDIGKHIGRECAAAQWESSVG